MTLHHKQAQHPSMFKSVRRPRFKVQPVIRSGVFSCLGMVFHSFPLYSRTFRVISCDLFALSKWPFTSFTGLSDLILGFQKVTWRSWYVIGSDLWFVGEPCSHSGHSHIVGPSADHHSSLLQSTLDDWLHINMIDLLVCSSPSNEYCHPLLSHAVKIYENRSHTSFSQSSQYHLQYINISHKGLKKWMVKII